MPVSNRSQMSLVRDICCAVKTQKWIFIRVDRRTGGTGRLGNGKEDQVRGSLRWESQRCCSWLGIVSSKSVACKGAGINKSRGLFFTENEACLCPF